MDSSQCVEISLWRPWKLCFNRFLLGWFLILGLGWPAARWKDFSSVLLRTGSDEGDRTSDLDNRFEVKMDQESLRERNRKYWENTSHFPKGFKCLMLGEHCQGFRHFHGDHKWTPVSHGLPPLMCDTDHHNYYKNDSWDSWQPLTESKNNEPRMFLLFSWGPEHWWPRGWRALHSDPTSQASENIHTRRACSLLSEIFLPYV